MLDDYELLYLASENNEEAIKELLNKYYKNLYLKSLKYNPSKSNIDDFLNESTLALYDAIYNYKDNVKFITYLNTCLENKLHNYKNILNRKKHSILNNAINIDDIEQVRDNTFNPEIILYNEECYIELKNKIIDNLNYQEELVFLLKEQGFSYNEISMILGKKLKTIYKYIYNIKKISNKIISSQTI